MPDERGDLVREALLALGLVCASGLVVTGVALLFVPAAFIVAGVLLAGLAVLMFAEVA